MPVIEKIYSAPQIALLQAFFDEHLADCFWSWNPHVKVTQNNAHRILHTAKTNGGQFGQALAIKLQQLASQEKSAQ